MFKFSEMSWDFLVAFINSENGRSLNSYDRRYIEDYMNTWQEDDWLEDIILVRDRDKAESKLMDAESKLAELKIALEKVAQDFDIISQESYIGSNSMMWKSMRDMIQSVIDKKF